MVYLETNPLLFALILTAVLFFIFLFIKQISPEKIKRKFCVICAAVSVGWLALLILFKLKIFLNFEIIALLMGQTILGIFYLWENKTREKFKLFRLPFLLTLTTTAYFILISNILIMPLLFLIILWFIFCIIYLLRDKESMGEIFRKILECCKKW